MSNIQQKFNQLLGVAAIGGRLYQDAPKTIKNQEIKKTSASLEAAKAALPVGPGLEGSAPQITEFYNQQAQKLAGLTGKEEDIARLKEIKDKTGISMGQDELHTYDKLINLAKPQANQLQTQLSEKAAEKALNSAIDRMILADDNKTYLAERKEMLKLRGEKK